MPSTAEGAIMARWGSWWVRFGLAVAAAILVADQISKWVILEHVMRPPRIIEVTGFFNLVMVWNPGVSFGMFGDGGEVGRWLLSALALAISAFLLHWLRQLDRWFPALAIGMVIGGAIGNVIDRVRFGAVADFLDFHVLGYHWPAFNIADSGIVVGVALLVFDQLFGPRPAGDGDDKDRTKT